MSIATATYDLAPHAVRAVLQGDKQGAIFHALSTWMQQQPQDSRPGIDLRGIRVVDLRTTETVLVRLLLTRAASKPPFPAPILLFDPEREEPSYTIAWALATAGVAAVAWWAGELPAASEHLWPQGRWHGGSLGLLGRTSVGQRALLAQIATRADQGQITTSADLDLPANLTLAARSKRLTELANLGLIRLVAGPGRYRGALPIWSPPRAASE